MAESVEAVGEAFLSSSVPCNRDSVLETPCPVPDRPGLYGWWFRVLPAEIDVTGCFRREDLTLLYVGISPTRPPTNGRAPSSQNLRKRIRTHFAGNAEGSTLRKTLGCLLTAELDIELRRVGSGNRMTFVLGEAVLSKWMGANALVSWTTHDEPWNVEGHLIDQLDLPLNLAGNARNKFHAELTTRRAAAVERARSLPCVPNPGVGGR